MTSASPGHCPPSPSWSETRLSSHQQASPEVARIRWSPDSIVDSASGPQPEEARPQAPLPLAQAQALPQAQVQHDSPARGLAPELRRYASFTRVGQDDTAP